MRRPIPPSAGAPPRNFRGSVRTNNACCKKSEDWRSLMTFPSLEMRRNASAQDPERAEFPLNPAAFSREEDVVTRRNTVLALWLPMTIKLNWSIGFDFRESGILTVAKPRVPRLRLSLNTSMREYNTGDSANAIFAIHGVKMLRRTRAKPPSSLRIRIPRETGIPFAVRKHSATRDLRGER